MNPTISALLGGVHAFLAGRPSTNCHSDCPVARLRLCPFSHRAWSIGGPAPGVSIRAGPPPVTRGVPPGNVATCAPHFGQDGSLILASLSLARGLQVALPDRGPVRCGTGYETRHAEHVEESGSTKGVRARGPTPDDDELLANRHAGELKRSRAGFLRFAARSLCQLTGARRLPSLARFVRSGGRRFGPLK